MLNNGQAYFKKLAVFTHVRPFFYIVHESIYLSLSYHTSSLLQQNPGNIYIPESMEIKGSIQKRN